MKIFGILISIAVLSACQTTAYQGNENSPYYLVPVGSVLKLTQSVEIPAEQVAVYLQGGKILPQEQINQYYPHCKFELLHRRDHLQTVKPDRFKITRVFQDIGHSVSSERIQLARLGIGLHIGAHGGDGPSIQNYRTEMALHSDTQPDVFRLSCGQDDMLHQGQHVTINEIRKVLGSVFILERKGT